jgi:hypothetical protein
VRESQYAGVYFFGNLENNKQAKVNKVSADFANQYKSAEVFCFYICLDICIHETVSTGKPLFFVYSVAKFDRCLETKQPQHCCHVHLSMM